jgi:hypothetical protein
MSSVFDEAEQLAKLVQNLNDREIAVRFLRHRLSELGPEQGAILVAQVFAHTETGDSSAKQLMLLISVALSADDALRFALAQSAEKHGDHEIFERLVSRMEPASEPSEMRVPDFGKGRPLTLGERKSLARRRDRDLIARVIRDPHPDVIRVLLGNPALTEMDVVRLCARRPIPVDVLREVFRAPRWMVREAVRGAMVRNPHTPLDVSLSLISHLAVRDVREIVNSPELHPSLREAGAKRLSPRAIH